MCYNKTKWPRFSRFIFHKIYIPVEYHWLVFLDSELADINLEDEPTMQDINLEDKPTIPDINLENEQYKKLT